MCNKNSQFIIYSLCLKRWFLVADCLHLQLYRDSKDRYKQGQTKASLSLQHFLGVQSGFTLDKESNTIAIICQDVTVVLAFDTRERLIQWQVKIANNLGEDEQFLVQIQSSPARGKVPPGPARLHVQDHRFCMTVGVPPRLVGYWQIGQLRRYGVVENRFCFEGGSRCGRGEGLYVLVTDQSKDVARAFQVAAEGNLASRKRHSGVNKSVVDSPRKRPCEELDEPVAWPSCETRPDCDYADTASVNEYPDNYLQDGGVWTVQSGMERCMSCISKLGAMSRSSTMAQTPGSGFTPAWTMETNAATESGEPHPPTSTSATSDLAQSTGSTEEWCHSNSSVPEKTCQCFPPPRPLLPLEINSLKTLKPPPPPPPSTCTGPQVGPYGNYDVPKPLPHQPSGASSCCSTGELYDTPKPLRERLGVATVAGEYGPQPANTCSCPRHGGAMARLVVDREEWRRAACPCHRVMSWMSLPYCRRGYGRENTAPAIQRVKLSGEGKMPVANPNQMPIYATVDRSKKTRCRLSQAENENRGSANETNNEEGASSKNNTTLGDSTMDVVQAGGTLERMGKMNYSRQYMNLEFVQSLEYYENSKALMNKTRLVDLQCDPQRHPVKYCAKCGHACGRGASRHDDYLMMGPSSRENVAEETTSDSKSSVTQFSGYLPMQPVSSGNSSKTDLLEYNLPRRRGHLSERAASSPSLSAPFVDRSKKPTDLELGVSESELCRENHSANSSPYLRRRLLNPGSRDEEPRYNSGVLRRRSNSADSARYLDDLESIAERTVSSSPTQINNLANSENTSIESLCSQSLSIKRLADVTVSNGSSCSNIPPCPDEVPVEDNGLDAVPYDKPGSPKKDNNDIPRVSIKDTSDLLGVNVHIRRSASVPCKSGHNRDSSSSNDSGVSVGSLKQRGSDFAEFELPLTTSMSTWRHHHALSQRLHAEHVDCFHASLPRRSKSSDPLSELTFLFRDTKTVAPTSSSAGAEVPILLIKKDGKGYLSPGGVPYIDSRSTSSGTSDMSDYIETLSLSSYSSSDTPESLRFSRTAATTLRPRSGKEYHKIDRLFLDGDTKKPPYTAIPPAVDSSECESILSPQPGH